MDVQMRISETTCDKSLPLEDICNDMEFLNGVSYPKDFSLHRPLGICTVANVNEDTYFS